MFKVGQKVWCAMFGEGVVTKILTCYNPLPVVVCFGDMLEWRGYTIDGKYQSHAAQTLFPYPVEIIKKVAKPSINWEHVNSKFNYLAEEPEGGAFLSEEEPFIAASSAWGVTSGEVVEAHMFASYVKGTCDWKDSLIKRPEVK